LKALKLLKIALLYDEGAYGKGQAEYAKAFLKQDGRVRVVTSEGISPGAVDYSELVREIKREGAEAVIFSGYPMEASKIIYQMRKEQMKAVFIADDGIKEDVFSKIIGNDAGGVYVTGPKDVSRNPMALAAIETYRQVFGSDPGSFYLNAYAAALALLNAVQKAGSTDFYAVKEALHTEAVDTPLGKIRFDVNGDVIGIGFSVYRVQNGTFAEIK
jgi:branched-chain amino acid transport system substrate-binding protein